ncbi:alpha/beta fold hydrolase [Alkalihalobacterium alkalinitrilicum]|uniref:alpha/beta fold hydrolase n=1 Tax=Alkalihalobacterium alkalinitrilicum TaxID=427920 RepID=UPI0009949AC7|nr:alpha/beta hydrolase [Alkalihalobacterium alkalinitrilicum]
MEKTYHEIVETKLVDGVKVHYEYYYHENHLNRPVIVLIHGFVSSTYSFRYLIPLLVKHYPVLAVDLPGFGQSEKSTSFVYSFHNYAQLIFTILTMLKIDRVVPVGHSMGGQVGLYMAKLKPILVEKVVLLSSSGYLKRAKWKFRYASYIPLAPHMVKRWFVKRNYKDALTYVVYNKTIVNDDTVSEYAKAFEDDQFFHSLIRILRHREGDLSADELNEIKQPVLILWGKYDKVIPTQIGKRLQLDIPNAKIFIFDETGHLVTEERPKESAEQIIEFLDGLRADPSSKI